MVHVGKNTIHMGNIQVGKQNLKKNTKFFWSQVSQKNGFHNAKKPQDPGLGQVKELQGIQLAKWIGSYAPQIHSDLQTFWVVLRSKCR